LILTAITIAFSFAACFGRPLPRFFADFFIILIL